MVVGLHFIWRLDQGRTDFKFLQVIGRIHFLDTIEFMAVYFFKASMEQSVSYFLLKRIYMRKTGPLRIISHSINSKLSGQGPQLHLGNSFTFAIFYQLEVNHSSACTEAERITKRYVFQGVQITGATLESCLSQKKISTSLNDPRDWENGGTHKMVLPKINI